MDFKIEILDKAKTCVLYSELHNADLSSAKGGFSLEIGSGSSPQNFLQGTVVLGWRVFENRGVATGAFTGCALPGVTMNAGTTTITSNKASTIATNAHAIATTTVAGEPGFMVFDTSANYRIGVGTSSPSSTFSVSGAGTLMVGANNKGTSTVIVDGRPSGTADGAGGCINMRGASDGEMYRIYVYTGVASSSLRVEVGLCK